MSRKTSAIALSKTTTAAEDIRYKKTTDKVVWRLALASLQGHLPCSPSGEAYLSELCGLQAQVCSLDDGGKMTPLTVVEETQRERQIVWETFPSWAQFSWLYLLSAVSALRGAMYFRVGVEGWEMWMAGSGMLVLCAVLVRRWAHYELTAERIIVRNGYTGHEISSVALADIRAVTIQQGPVAGFFGIGTLTISFSSMERVVSLRGIRDPEDVKIRIQASAWRKSQTPEIRLPQGEP